MIATLRFMLPEDRDEFDVAVHGGDWREAMREVTEELRTKIKHGDLSEDDARIFTEVRDMIFSVLDDRELSL